MEMNKRRVYGIIAVGLFFCSCNVYIMLKSNKKCTFVSLHNIIFKWRFYV